MKPCMLCYCNSYVERINLTAIPLTASITIQPSRHLTTRSSQISCAARVHSLTETQLSPKARKSKSSWSSSSLSGRGLSEASSSTALSSSIPLASLPNERRFNGTCLSLSLMHDPRMRDTPISTPSEKIYSTWSIVLETTACDFTAQCSFRG